MAQGSHITFPEGEHLSADAGHFTSRLAGAPISWGVCEVPGWGVEIPPRRVLSEMQQLGLSATELGSDGYLPADPAELKQLCAEYDLTMIGGFVPLVVHEPSERERTLEQAARVAQLMSAAGGTMFVTSAVATWDWGPRRELDAAEWRYAAETLAMLDEVVGAHGMTQAVHPHLQTMVETRYDVESLLEASDVGWTFDMGHLQIGGTDPLEFLDAAFDRIRHVHLKDVAMDIAQHVFAGERSIMQGVQSGMFTNLGRGDVPVAEIVRRLEDRGYSQWYVIEQDAAITDGMPADGEGPLLDVLASIEFLRGIETPVSA